MTTVGTEKHREERPDDPWSFLWPEIEQAIEMGRAQGYTDDEIEERVLEALPDAIDEAIASSTEVLYRTVSRSRARMLRQHKRAQSGFERRLWQCWGRALDLYYACYVACQEVGATFNQTYRGAAAADNDFRFEALCLLHARACKTASAIYSLLRTGHAADAQARWRTMHELAVVACLLSDADAEISNRFLLHGLVENYKDALEYQRHCDKLGYAPYTDDEMAAIREAADAVSGQFGGLYERDWGWAESLIPTGARLRFATLEGLAHLDHHRPFYRWANHGTHAGSKGTHMNRADLPQGPVFLAGPSNASLADPGHGSLIALVQVTICFILNGRDGDATMDPMAVPTLRVLQQMCADAGDAFLAAHEEQERAVEERGVHIEGLL